MIQAVAIPGDQVVDPTDTSPEPRALEPGVFYPGLHIPETNSWRVLEYEAFNFPIGAKRRADAILAGGFAASQTSTENDNINHEGTLDMKDENRPTEPEAMAAGSLMPTLRPGHFFALERVKSSPAFEGLDPNEAFQRMLDRRGSYENGPRGDPGDDVYLARRLLPCAAGGTTRRPASCWTRRTRFRSRSR